MNLPTLAIVITLVAVMAGALLIKTAPHLRDRGFPMTRKRRTK